MQKILCTILNLIFIFNKNKNLQNNQLRSYLLLLDKHLIWTILITRGCYTN